MAKNINYFNQSDKSAYLKFKNKKKEVFKQVEKIISKEKNKKTILDIGTANGELIFNLSKRFGNKYKYSGFDISKELIKVAKLKQPNHNFKVFDIDKNKSKEKFDIVILLGVSGYYDDLRNLITKSLKLTNKNGIIILEGGVNFNNFDVRIKFREFSRKKVSKWENGFNSISQYSIINFLKKNKLKHKFLNWKFKVPIKFNKVDEKIRNRTFKDNKNNYWLINGINLVTHGPINNHLNHNASMLIIKK